MGGGQCMTRNDMEWQKMPCGRNIVNPAPYMTGVGLKEKRKFDQS